MSTKKQVINLRNQARN